MFKNESPLDFSLRENRELFQSAIEEVAEEIRTSKLAAMPIVGGKQIKTADVFERRDPSSPDQTVGKVYYASESEAAKALDLGKSAQDEWKKTSSSERADVLRKTAELMRSSRMRLAAIIIRENGKTWAEADADVCEAIDFCDYYASEFEALAAPRRTMEVMGEQNWYFYQPRGLAVVISPWNFPLAIACGMTVAALVCGNCTILKPAEQTSIIAFELAQILLKAGVPPNAFAFLPGDGEVIGRQLVNSPMTDLICFTGSKAVGLEIIQSAAVVHPGQKNVKKVIAEMGGKNAIIVDEDADLDEAIKGVLYSAFGFAGQKCSACSRVIVVGDAYKNFMERICDAAGDLIVGDASDPASYFGPVIDQETQSRLLEQIKSAEASQQIAFKGSVPQQGCFVPAAIFRDVETTSDLWRKELFGPVLACRSAKSFEEAITIANDCEYALTGGVYSRSPANIEFARENFSVGNLYINRGCTGALVCRQPFGGFRMSGVGSKAGGPDYLLQFVEPRAVSENTMRKGFTLNLHNYI